MVPTYGGFAKPDEIRKVKLMVRGHYWIDKEWENYVSFSPTGLRAFFEYNLCSLDSPAKKKKISGLARSAAYFWAKGQYKKAKELYKKAFDE